MPSIHQWKSIDVAIEKGAYAGSHDVPDVMSLWAMNKRELVEIAIRLGVLVADDDSPAAGAAAAMQEYQALKNSKIV